MTQYTEKRIDWFKALWTFIYRICNVHKLVFFLEGPKKVSCTIGPYQTANGALNSPKLVLIWSNYTDPDFGSEIVGNATTLTMYLIQTGFFTKTKLVNALFFNYDKYIADLPDKSANTLKNRLSKLSRMRVYKGKPVCNTPLHTVMRLESATKEA